MNATRSYDLGLVWLRRDLRLEDNTALHHALALCRRVQLAFVYDRAILDKLPSDDRRMPFIHRSVGELHAQLQQLGPAHSGGLVVLHGWPAEDVPRLAASLGAGAVFANQDDEPYALERDGCVARALADQGVAWHSFKDHTVFARHELLNAAGQPYRVFTPYQREWMRRVTQADLAQRDCSGLARQCAPLPSGLAEPPTLGQIGFRLAAAVPDADGWQGGRAQGVQLLHSFLGRMDKYEQRRDFPGVLGPSYLGVHLRFGTVSVREVLRAAWPLQELGDAGARAWVRQLVWRDFFAQILAHFPHVVDGCFRPEYDALSWEEGPRAEAHFQAWCTGRTGYPLVDAGMRQLAQTGYMHNRLRMLAASFLVKHLGIDWRRGEAHFAAHLLDYDLASNNGGWQWASSTGCDAQPYFRVFNPVTQSRKFDPQGRFILRYVPQLQHSGVRDVHAPWTGWPSSAAFEQATGYPAPVIALEAGRARTLLRYGAIGSMPRRSSPAPD